MVHGRISIWTASLVCAATVAGATSLLAAPRQQTQGGAPPQQQGIPDAPRPQTLPRLNTITPVGAAVTPPAPLPTESTSDGQRAPGTSLPSSPGQTIPPRTRALRSVRAASSIIGVFICCATIGNGPPFAPIGSWAVRAPTRYYPSHPVQRPG